jgi:hypothetical protein
VPRPLIGTGVFVAAVAVTVLAWLIQPPAAMGIGDILLLVALMAAVAGSRWIRIRAGKSAVLYFSSIPLYLLACLFAPPLAAAATGAGMLVREIIACRRCVDNTGGVIGAQVGRWMLLSGAVSTVVHLIQPEYLLYAGTLAAVLLWIGDVCSAPVVFSPVTGQHPARVIVDAARQSYAGELMQYLIALFALALIRTAILWIEIVYVPLIVLCVLLLYLYLRGVDDAAQARQQAAEATRSKSAKV